MAEFFDFSDAATKFAAAVAADVYEKSVKRITRSLSISTVSISHSIAKFIAADASRAERIRTIVSDAPVRLSQVYQPLYFDGPAGLVGELQLRQQIDQVHQITIKGGAGAGKSMFMRRHFLRRIEERGAIPLFIELRAFSASAAENFFMFLFETAKGRLPWLEVETFRELLRRGHVELLLDALDEVSHARRGHANTSISTLINEFPKAKIVVTTRFGDRYAQVPTAQEYRVRPFSKDQAVSLIQNLDFDEESKGRFSVALQEELYDKHSDLLSNPLLCSLMLLTYRRHNKIPDRIHLYYQQAFEVLFSRHDASKNSGVARDFLSKLDVAQMQRILDYFSAVTYAYEKFEFSESDALEYIREAIEVSELNCEAVDVKDDLIEAVSMLNRDGMELKFSHRSFQEYFCAHYISVSPNATAAGCIDAVKGRIDTDSVVDLAYALNPDRFEEAWLEPSLESDLHRWQDLHEQGKFGELLAQASGSAWIDSRGLHIEVSSVGSEDNFGLYTKLIDGAGSILPLKIDLDVRDLGLQLGDAPVFRNTKTKEVLFQTRAFELLSRAFPAHVRTWQRSECPAGPLVIDLAGRIDPNLFATLSAFPIWSDAGAAAIEVLRDWADQIRAKRIARGTPALNAFRNAARNSNSGRRRKSD